MKTLIANSKTIQRKWYIVDASELPVGRIATEVANILRGKNKTTFNPSQDMGDYVVIINSDKIVLTGRKWDQKMYYKHSGYKGGLKSRTASKLHEDDSTSIIYKAIAGMVPPTRLKTPVLSKLFIYSGNEHPHDGQKPETISFK